MPVLFWFVFFVPAALLMLAIPYLRWRAAYHKFHGPRSVICPETRSQVDVEVNASLAARSALTSGTEQVRLEACDRWPTRQDCGQDCLPQAIARSEEFDRLPGRIHHGAVIAAAVFAWLGLGLIRYSPAGRDWAAAAGLDPAMLRTQMEWVAPALEGLLLMLALAYATAAELAFVRLRGVMGGIGAGMGLWVATTLIAGVFNLARGTALAPVALDAAYLLVASIFIGAIVGAWQRTPHVAEVHA